MRCLTLGRALRAKGAECLFVHRLHKGHMADHIRSEGFAVMELPAPSECSDALPEDEYRLWLGVSPKIDAAQTGQVLKDTHLDWLVVDHYAIDAEWESTARTYAPHIMALDDLADRVHDCDVLLDQNYFREPEQRYTGLAPKSCQLLAGARFALLRPEFSELRRLIGPRRGPVARLLVFYGGVDPSNETSRALRVLSRTEFRQFAVDVVIGANNPHRDEIEDLSSRRQMTEVHGPQEHLAGLMAEADLALGAGGTTTWERCTTGLPSIVTAIARNQEPFNRALAEDGSIIYLGRSDETSDDALAATLRDLVGNPERLAALTRRAWRVTDGLGALRVAESIFPTLKNSLSLRRTRADDTALYLECGNGSAAPQQGDSPLRHRSAIRCKLVDHKLDDSDIWQRVMCTPQGLPVGQVRITRHGSEAILDGCVDHSFSGRDWGTHLLELAIRAWSEVDSGTPPWGKALSYDAPVRPPLTLASRVKTQRNTKDRRALSITLLSDPSSWINCWIPALVADWLGDHHKVRWVNEGGHLRKGDLCFLLGCSQVLSRDLLALHEHNLVIHESDLPKGRGWSPLTWLVLKDARRIPVTLIEALAQTDAGDIYHQHWIDLDGYELIDELRSKQARATLDLCREFVDRYPGILDNARPQHGEPTWYPRRTRENSELDPDLTLREQFNLLRVVDNDRYPAFFRMGKRFYKLIVEHDPND